MATPTKAELLKTAAELGLEISENATNAEITEAIKAASPKVEQPVETVAEPEVEPVVEPEVEATPEPTPTAEAETGNAIATAIAEGLKNATEASKHKIVITSDSSVKPRFSRVRNAEGEILIRDNETGALSELQLKSIEEKNNSLQDQEVQEL